MNTAQINKIRSKKLATVVPGRNNISNSSSVKNMSAQTQKNINDIQNEILWQDLNFLLNLINISNKFKYCHCT